MVRKERLELSRPKALEPKSSVYTNFTPSASGVDDGARTHDNRNHNPGLYQLSYAHQSLTLMPGSHGAPGRIRTCDHPLRRRVLYPAELRALYESRTILEKVVGETGFEPATPWTQTKCATKLRYSPTYYPEELFSVSQRGAHSKQMYFCRQTLF